MTHSDVPPTESFRDRLGIVSSEGTRTWIYPRQPSGRFYRARTVLSWFLIAFLFGMPFLRLNGHPVMLFDITERRFILFGQIFGPHDFILLALAMIAAVVFIVLFTVVFGRLFCGWVCPQTVLMELVFRKLDYLIEGPPKEQRRLSVSPWTGAKFLKKGTKYAVYFILSFLIANALLAWIIGTDKLFKIVSDPPSEHLGGLTAILIFTTGFDWIFSWFREQACILVCPYGRLQGVLLDRNSVVIAYDPKRGEPRGKIRKGERREAGDCIDCKLCVDVCPTGIDIRNGTQLECVNCTACIDACDGVMDSIDTPRGLIRYDSLEGIETGVRRLATPRSIGYSVVLLLLVALVGYLGATRSELDATILRTPGMFFQDQPDEKVSNLYDVEVLNKTFDPLPVSIRVVGNDGEAVPLGGPLTAPPQQPVQSKLMVVFPKARLSQMSTPIRLEVLVGLRVMRTIETTFLGPGRKRGTP
jgi:cytochrome c oxidase accessory protein FixG